MGRSQAWEELGSREGWKRKDPSLRTYLRTQATWYSVDEILGMLDVAGKQGETELSHEALFCQKIDGILDYLSRTGWRWDKKATLQRVAASLSLDPKIVESHILMEEILTRYDSGRDIFLSTLSDIKKSYQKSWSLSDAISQKWKSTDKGKWSYEVRTFPRYKDLLNYCSLRYFWAPLDIFVATK
jgi:hypothetical protein